MQQTASQIRFDRKTMQRLYLLAKPFFSSDQKWLAWGLVMALACFSISVNLLNVLMSYINRDFMTALSLREKDEFLKQLIYYLMAFLGVSPVIVLYRFTEERFAVLWRKWLSLKTLERYFSNRAYYKINSYEGIDNPDQRIEEDIRSFCGQSLSILLIIFNSIITLTAFSGILWSISWILVIAVLAYAGVGSALAYFMGRPLIGLNFTQLRLEADYRYKLVNVRDNAESISFYHAEPVELTRSRQRLKRVLKNLLLIIKRNVRLNFFITNYNYVLQILPIVIVSPLYLDGKIEFGKVIQAGSAFAAVVNALSIIVTNFGQLSSLTAVITRLGTFWEALEDVQKTESGEGYINREVGSVIAFRGVSITTPKRNQVVLRNLNFELANENLLITGVSGSGKSSILRSLSGLWNSGSGTIIVPPRDESVFLPQRPYMVLGTFRNQLLYGLKKKGLTDTALLAVVNQVGLGDTLARIGGFQTILDWPNFLSTGEQQRVAFARLFLQQPSYVFLDESTTAIDPKSEAYLYGILRNFTKCVVSVGHKASLAQFHDHILELSGDGTFTYYKKDAAEVKGS